MKRRTRLDNARAQKKRIREAAKFRSPGRSRYARKVLAGQMYGPVPQVPKFPDFQIGWRFVP